MRSWYRHTSPLCHVRIRPLVLLCLVFALLATPLPSVRADALTFDRQTAAIDRALAWLLAQQQPDGSWPTAFGHPAGVTLDVVLAGRAVGRDVSAWRLAESATDPLSYLAEHAADYSASAAATGKLVVGLVAAGLDVSDLAGFDAVAKLRGYAQPTGAFGDPSANPTLADQAWAMLALAALRAPQDARAVSELLSRQNADGGWGWAVGQGSDPDSTALAVQALAAHGASAQSAEVQAALAYLKTLQGGTGAIESWGAPNASSTAYVLQALTALGQNPLSQEWRTNGGTLLDGLLALQTAEGGLAGYDGSADVFATAQALPALAGKALPLLGPVPALQAALDYVQALQQGEGGLDDGLVADALLALSAAGQDPFAWRDASGRSLTASAVALADQADNAGKAGRLLWALAKAGASADVAPTLLAVIEKHYDRASGQYDPNGNVWNQAYALLALAETDAQPPEQAVAWLAASQRPDGGWPWAVGFLSDSNSTAIAARALVACGYPTDSFVLRKAAAYLRSVQAADGGFRYDTSPLSAEGDGNSTALVAQALLALGLDPWADWRFARPGPQGAAIMQLQDRLYALQTESGAFAWLPEQGANPLATLQIIPLLAAQVRAQRVQRPVSVTTPAAPVQPKEAVAASAADLGAWGPSLEAWRKGLILSGATMSAVAAPSGLAAVIVQLDADRAIVRVTPLEGQASTGWDVLQAAGLPLEAQRGFVCSLAGVGCPPDDCFCGGNSWWGYWHLAEGEWQMAMTGASASLVRPGDVEGWRWGEGDAPLAVQAADLFDPERLSPGAPRVVTSGGSTVVRVDYQGDVNQNAQVVAAVHSVSKGTPLGEPVRLTRLASVGLFAGSLDAAGSADDRQLCIAYTDPDGVNGSAAWCVPLASPAP